MLLCEVIVFLDVTFRLRFIEVIGSCHEFVVSATLCIIIIVILMSECIIHRVIIEMQSLRISLIL